jgi:exosortase/archaeosortase family protein
LNQKIKSITIFLIFFSLLYLIDSGPFFIQESTAGIVSFSLDILGYENIVSGNTINLVIESGEFQGVIDWDCTGWKSVVLFLGLVFASPRSLKKKLQSFIFIPIIYIINIFRIIFMFIAVYLNTDLFYLIHQFFWSYGLIFVVFVLWFIWYADYSKIKAKKLISSKQKLINSIKNKNK